MTRNTLAATSLALLSLLIFAPVQAATYGTVTIQSSRQVQAYNDNRPVYLPAPPPPRYEALPRQRQGQIWVPGHWEWRGRHHVWMSGYWLPARPGYYYRNPRWEQRNGHWEMHDGRWDRDGNGVPDHYQRRGDRHWDRDGDGVPNRYDQRPQNPYRR